MDFVVGQIVRLAHSVYNDAAVLTNATTITLAITLPDGTTIIPGSITNTGTGTYRYDYTTTLAGRHTYRWDTSGPTAPGDGTFDVRPTTAGIVSLADVKQHLNKSVTVVTDDEELRAPIEFATEKIEDYLGKYVVRRTVVEEVTPSTSDLIFLRGYLISLTSLTSLDTLTTWSVTSSTVRASSSGMLTRLSGTYWSGKMLATYVAGLTVIPTKCIESAKDIIEARWMHQRQPSVGPPSPFGSEFGSPGGSPGVPLNTAVERALSLLGPRPPMVA